MSKTGIWWELLETDREMPGKPELSRISPVFCCFEKCE
nr:MAG TPA: hypothetical protein [Caudoviricetes sp.]